MNEEIMRNRAKRLVPAYLICLTLAAWVLHRDIQNPDVASASADLHALFDEVWETNMRTYPEWATSLGDDGYNDRFTNKSLEGIERRQRHEREALERLAAIDREGLSAEDRLNYDLFKREYKIAIEGHAFRTYLMPITQLDGPQLGFPHLVQNTDFRKVKDYEDFLKRLRALPVLIDQTIALMRAGVEAGWVVPRAVLDKVPDQIAEQFKLAPDESPLFQPFADFPDTVPGSEQMGRAALEADVFPAYERLYDYFVDGYLPATREHVGAWSLPDGQRLYAFRAREYTTTDLTPGQIHEIGLAEVKRIRAEMDRIITDLEFDGNFRAFAEFLRTDPRFYHDSEEELLAGYRDICKRIEPQLPNLFGRLPRMPYGVKRIPDYAAPARPTAYYMRPAADGSRAGYFYANTYNLKTRPKYQMEALTLHEAVPGHHMQIALAMELEGLPNFRRYGGFTAFVEGWGLYSEGLGEELGLYRDPYSRFGRLTYEMWRACRLVVDTGMHHFEWDRRRAIDFMLKNNTRGEHDVIVEIDRYIVWPGQALAYKIGELKIKELRNLARTELGADFDITHFHDTVLGAGALPLDVLERRIRETIASAKPE